MRALMAVVAVGMALAACAPSQDTTAPDPTPAVSSMAPGQYRTTVTYASVPTPVTDEQCVTSADIADLVNGIIATDDAQACSENTLNTANGRIEGRVVCLDAQGSPRTMEISGTYGNNRADMDIAVTASENGVTATQQGRVAIERVGAC
jgi:predicted lipoprotein